MVSPQPGAPNRRSMAALLTGLLPRSDPRHEASDGDVRANFGRAAEQNPGQEDSGMDGVFANRSTHRDFLTSELQRRGVGGRDVYIAVAFFTEPDVVEGFLSNGCDVWLVVRLGFPTNPAAIERVMKNPRLKLRVYTARTFHPKLYIFGDEVALVGSANLTNAAITSNQEVVVSIGSEDKRFVELTAIFQDYWDGADVPTEAMLTIYKEMYTQYEKHEDAAELLARQAAEKLGNTSPDNINRGKKKPAKQLLFVAHFRKAYQEGVAAFNIVRRVYAASEYRKASEAEIPLRIEIDSFISFVREREAVGESWQSAPSRTEAEQEPLIAALIERWKETPWPHFEDKIIGENYPRLRRVFASPGSIMAANDEDLFDALATLHSFHDRFRFFEGGLKTWKQVFPRSNDPLRTRSSLAYLVFGEGDIVERMAGLIFDPRYKLDEFGQANVQELVGWCNREELPILNGRTTKVLRFFGSRVRQVQ